MFRSTHAVTADPRSTAQGTPRGTPSDTEPTRTGEPQSSAVSDDVPGAPAIPQRSRDRYQIIEEHGRGGLGRVSRARDRDLGRDIAIKEMLASGHLNEVRFLREALITARLQHPSIVPIYEAGRWPDGTPFYAMKLVAGHPLRSLIAERATVDQRLGLLHHVIAVADAIAYAHGRNIIHRDLKPANVIVGDFGETVVIDWGLAKDLSVAEEPSAGGGPSSASGSDLTEAGDILGTPTYMAPEQERGEYVDQRADVYAIGAMLWELCSLVKLPADLRLRRRLLRSAGIDRDLAIVVHKALDPDPALRYPDAGALASDLRAFTSGARIAARRYSVVAVLGHWIRRHRALGATIGAALALAVGGGVFYVRSIAAERDRVAASNNRLILKHAELLLQGDPSAAHDLLGTYSGSDAGALDMLRAKAQGLGVAILRAKPHTQTVMFARPRADGSLITLSDDGTIARTTADGASRAIATGFTEPYAFDYAERARVLAYTCEAGAICLFDLDAGTARAAARPGSSFTPAALALSPGGDRLAAVSAGGETLVWDVSGGRLDNQRHEAEVRGARSITFADDTTLAVHAAERIAIIHLGRDGRRSDAVAELAVPGGNGIDASGSRQRIAAGTGDGALVVIDSRTDAIVRRETVCVGSVNRVLVMPGRAAIAYACQDGDAGIWDEERGKLEVLAHIEGGAARLAGSADGRYLLVAGSSRLIVHDFATQMLRSYAGHTTRLTTLVPPSPAFPYLISGDTMGMLRAWAPPDATARVAIRTTAALYKAVPVSRGGPLIAIGASATIPWYARTGESGVLVGHDPSHVALIASRAEPRVVIYGAGSDELEMLSFAPEPTHRVVKWPHGAVGAAAFTLDGKRLVIGSHDGAITEWTDDDHHRELWSLTEPVEYVRVAGGSDRVVIAGASDALWLGTATGLVRLGSEPDRVASAVCSYDGRWFALGTVRGAVRLYDLSTGTSEVIVRGEPWIGVLNFSPDSRSLGIVTGNKVILHPTPGTPGARREIDLAARSIAFSPDGGWLALTADHGEVWFYRQRDDHWVYLSLGTARIPLGVFSDDSASFVATDSSGRALLIDMRAKVFD
jgi:WD40 repeat protein